MQAPVNITPTEAEQDERCMYCGYPFDAGDLCFTDGSFVYCSPREARRYV